MSSNLAYARPLSSPVRETHPRHIEIVTTRAQRRARPKVAYAVATIASLFLIFAAQLLLSIVVSDGAYQISGLQAQQKDLLREQQALSERLDLLSSTQHLAANAAHIGMVPNASPLILDLETGAVTTAPGTIDPTGCGGSCNLVPNSLLTGVPLANAATPDATTPDATTQGQTTQGSTQNSSTTPDGALPAPVTH